MTSRSSPELLAVGASASTTPFPHASGVTAAAATTTEKERSHSTSGGAGVARAVQVPTSSTTTSSGNNTASTTHRTTTPQPQPHTTNTAEPTSTTATTANNNVTTTQSSSRQWPPPERIPSPAAAQHQHPSSRTAHIPRSNPGTAGTGTFSSGSRSLSTSRSPSTVTSPHSSRDSSPAGRIFRQQSVPGAASSGMRNSHEVSPHRPPSITGYTSSVPSAAAIQRALSAATTPQLQSSQSQSQSSEPASRVPRPARGSNTPSESTTPSWPISPRLKSPPPSGSRRNSLRTQKRSDAVAPNIVIQSATPMSSTDALPLIDQELEQELRTSTAQLAKTASTSRGVSGAPTLETVQETSGPNTPGNDLNVFSSNDPNQKYFDMPEEKISSGSSTPRRSMAPPANKQSTRKTSNSDSDGGEKKEETKKPQETDPDTTPRPKAPSSRASYSSLRQKTGAPEPATRNMTVETEIVNSVAQNTIGAPSDRVSSRAEHGGTLRTKASNDTIKPSKSRKKASRKAPSITATSGTYDPTFFSPPDTSTSLLTSPRLRRREAHPFLSGASRAQQPQSHPQSSQSALQYTYTYSSFPSSPESKKSTTRPETALTVRSEEIVRQNSTSPLRSHLHEPQPSRFQLLRRRSSQWLSSYIPFSTPTSPLQTDFRTREGSTRADIFEDRVKNAMDEETSDDSDETFVYESNPADQPIRRSRHHSRTPSGASLTSMAGRERPQGLLSTTKTRSMKFANAYNSADDDAIERDGGTVRGNNPSTRGSAVHHHHTGRPSRSTTGHASILDDDSPFPQLNKVRSLTGLPNRQTQNARIAARNLQASNGHGPVNGNGASNGNGNGNGARKDGYSTFDLDAEAADDERTPLLTIATNNSGTIRTPRSVRRPPTRSSRPQHYPRRRQGMLARFAGCVAILAMLFLLIFGIVGFLFIITTPLIDVMIHEIQSPLASETEMMFDLKIGATNPNLLPISVSECDFNVFAKSKYVGTEKWWRDHPDGDWADEPLPSRSKEDGMEVGAQDDFKVPKIPGIFPSDPDDDDDTDDDSTKQTMLLGRVFHFDNTLTFEPSFWHRHNHNSTGAIRLQKPGNHTELGGSERWERVVLHEFELIVRGTLRYLIPLGGKEFRVNVGARVLVDPREESGPGEGEGKPPGKGKKPKEGEVNIRGGGGRRKWKVTVLPFEEEESVVERLKRRVFARLLRTL